MVKTITIERSGETRVVQVRQMPHDKQLTVNQKFKYGSGKAWTVTAIQRDAGLHPVFADIFANVLGVK